MNKYFKVQFAVVIFPLLMLLTGCNSREDSSESNPPVDATPPVEATPPDTSPPVEAAVIEISVTPSPVLVLEGRTQQLVAMAKYDDDKESDVSDSVTWEIVGDPTKASISVSGLLTGDGKGDTEITASKNGITSDTVKVTVCDLAGPCIDIFDTGSGKLFTNSPSVAYLDSIGGSATDDTFTETGINGPAGDFYKFNWDNANALCDTYSTKNIGGRTNWRLTTSDELKVELFDAYGNVFTALGWPNTLLYWSVTPDDANYYRVHLINGYEHSSPSNSPSYASCVSNP